MELLSVTLRPPRPGRNDDKMLAKKYAGNFRVQLLLSSFFDSRRRAAKVAGRKAASPLTLSLLLPVQSCHGYVFLHQRGWCTQRLPDAEHPADR